jgi:LuxR family maltose regulon positive regulatory protein
MQERHAYGIGVPAHLTSQIESRVLYERNDLEGALLAARQALEVCGQFPAAQFIEMNRMLIVVALAAGRQEEARERLRAMELLPLSEPDRKLVRVIDMMRAYLAMAEGRIEDAAIWVAELEREAPGTTVRIETGSFMYRAYASILYARILNALGRRGDAVGLLETLLADLSAKGMILAAVQAGAVLALLLEADGDSRSLDILEQTLRLGAHEGFVRSFAADGGAMGRIIEKYRTSRRKGSGIPSEYIHSLLYACGVAASESAARASTIDDPDALTSRELEILRLMSIGYSNQKIADKLYLSINTIKTHISNLFDKLGARNRVDALVRAREAGVLE